MGNSIQSHFQGDSHVFFLNRPEEHYVLSNPNMYARGILFGRMLLELGDSVRIECERTGFVAEIDFLVKGYFTGTYNAISGKIFDAKSGRILYTLSGKWTDAISISAATPNVTSFLYHGCLNFRQCPSSSLMLNIPSLQWSSLQSLLRIGWRVDVFGAA